MADRPSEFLDWIPDNTTNIIEPPTGLKNTGWPVGTSPPAQYFNWLLNLTNQWLEYLDEVASGWPNIFVDSEASFIDAIAQATTDGGGVICLQNSITLSGTRLLPVNTTLLGRDGFCVLTMGTSGILQMDDQARLQDVYIEATKSSGNLVEMIGSSVLASFNQFTVDPGDSLVCISVQGNACGITQNVFRGVLAPSVAVGIQFEAGFVDGYERDNTFY